MGGTATVFGVLAYLFVLAASAAVAWLLLRAYHRGRMRVLFWFSLCFGLLTLNNAETLLDYVTPPWFDLSIPRTATMLVAVGVMLYGFIWEAR